MTAHGTVRKPRPPAFSAAPQARSAVPCVMGMAVAAYRLWGDVVAVQPVTGISRHDIFLVRAGGYSQPDDDEHRAAIFIDGIYPQPAVVRPCPNRAGLAGTGVSVAVCGQWVYALGSGTVALFVSAQ
ncbi:hypothetical protein Xinn_04180 [Xenorhabdus innexi]|uniref:Uncharacterized protein n=1 Tax=Xenorhabdus innexi TaxID=290109 RepID=A0A2G0MHJ3_9GAMM|nr:hypothetical protein Xinn_04180 [Xenorhabdus innexi]